jgi:hypothetical protein
MAADYLNMTPQGVHQASERGWIAYFQHGRNRLYSYKDVLRYRWQSRKFKVVAETAATPTPPDVLAAHKAKIQASLEDAAKEIVAMNRAGLPWPRPRL